MNNVDKKFRSRMNIIFRVNNDKDLEKQFLAECTKLGMIDLAGHPALGGVRASCYNAMPLAGVEKLVKFMKDFQSRHQGRAKL